MARYEFKLPDIGEGITEGEIVGWAEGVQVGIFLKADQPLVEVMTDKTTVTITSPRAGRILELGGPVGQVIAVGKILAVFEVDEAQSATQPVAAVSTAPAVVAAEPEPQTLVDQSPRAESAATAVGDIREHLPGMGPDPDLAPAPAVHELSGDPPLAAPATRKLARELGLELRMVAGSGPGGRITLDDVKSHADRTAAKRKGAATPMPSEPMRIASVGSTTAPADERVPMRGVRKRIFEAMARSKHTAAHFTFVEECDVTALKAMRERMRALTEGRGVSLSFLPFIIKACVAALKRHPWLNSAYDEATEEIVVRRYYNIGIATATEAGLIVPVVKGADQRSLLDIAAEIQRLSNDARQSKIKLEDIQGSTFTITSLGAQGGLFATPILNFPEVGSWVSTRSSRNRWCGRGRS